jgi:hypothetical protein
MLELIPLIFDNSTNYEDIHNTLLSIYQNTWKTNLCNYSVLYKVINFVIVHL